MTAFTSPSESVHHSSSNPFNNVAFVDDFTVCGKLESLKQWFGEICRLAPFIGHYVNPTKIWLIVKDHELDKAFRIFAGTGIKITLDCRRHLEGVFATNDNKISTLTRRLTNSAKK